MRLLTITNMAGGEEAFNPAWVVKLTPLKLWHPHVDVGTRIHLAQADPIDCDLSMDDLSNLIKAWP